MTEGSPFTRKQGARLGNLNLETMTDNDRKVNKENPQKIQRRLVLKIWLSTL